MFIEHKKNHFITFDKTGQLKTKELELHLNNTIIKFKNEIIMVNAIKNLIFGIDNDRSIFIYEEFLYPPGIEFKIKEPKNNEFIAYVYYDGHATPQTAENKEAYELLKNKILCITEVEENYVKARGIKTPKLFFSSITIRSELVELILNK